MKNLYLLALLAVPCIALAQTKTPVPKSSSSATRSASKPVSAAQQAAYQHYGNKQPDVTAPRPQQRPRLNVFTAQPNPLSMSNTLITQYGYSSGYQVYATPTRPAGYNPYGSKPANYNVFTQHATMFEEDGDEEWYEE